MVKTTFVYITDVKNNCPSIEFLKSHHFFRYINPEYRFDHCIDVGEIKSINPLHYDFTVYWWSVAELGSVIRACVVGLENIEPEKLQLYKPYCPCFVCSFSFWNIARFFYDRRDYHCIKLCTFIDGKYIDIYSQEMIDIAKNNYQLKNESIL